MGIFGDGRGQPTSGRAAAAKRPRPAAGIVLQVLYDRCRVASAKVEVITRAGSVFLRSHRHHVHRDAILAAGLQIRTDFFIGL